MTQNYHQTPTADNDSLEMTGSLQEVSVVTRRAGMSRLGGAENGMRIGRDELFKAACCNLGESFTTNPSVDVSYNDATTGAQQIKLLGLSGTYVQMLTENFPNYRGAAAPYALGYVPGPWMKSISVSKGASSVKNGYESITGQIDVEFKKPDDENNVEINLFGDTKSRFEANADANARLNERLSTEILTHYENSFEKHDDNGDGFLDKPNVRQYHLQNRWKWAGEHYLFHGGIAGLKEKRESGQISHGGHGGDRLFMIGLETDRYEAYVKNAFIIDNERGTNIALMASGSTHSLDAEYGDKAYGVDQKNAYASLMFETNFTKRHNLSAGLSLNHDYLKQRYRMVNELNVPLTRDVEKETVPGAYAQYTLDLDSRLVAMAGLRVDHSSLYGTFVTPRFHVKWMPTDIVSLRLSAGKGYRTVHALAENNYLLASGRQLVIGELGQEAAWNYGTSLALNIPLAGETLKLNAEYYYTRFSNQAIIDYDTDPKIITISDMNGKSYSHTLQIDASYNLFKTLTLTAAYRRNDVKESHDGKLRDKPLTSKYKGLFTASYKTGLGLWQVDATLQLNGGGRLPDPYKKPDGTMSWNDRFHSYIQLNAQITRWFRHFSVYVGGENLTNFTQKTSILGADNPWGEEFEPTMIWGPVHGRKFYAGVRINF